jgi:hypothetical protein
MKIIFILFFASLIAISAQEPTSFYSTTQPKFCAVLSSSELEEEPEIDHFEHLCPGYGEYEILHRSGDSRSWLDVRHQKTVTSDLYSETMKEAQGFFPAKQNDVVEWRGILQGNIFTPFALIYRIQVGDPEDSTQSVSRLLVIELAQGQSKVLGSITGKDADARAKALADTVAP